jgi:hypothetical protein
MRPRPAILCSRSCLLLNALCLGPHPDLSPRELPPSPRAHVATRLLSAMLPYSDGASGLSTGIIKRHGGRRRDRRHQKAALANYCLGDRGGRLFPGVCRPVHRPPHPNPAVCYAGSEERLRERPYLAQCSHQGLTRARGQPVLGWKYSACARDHQGEPNGRERMTWFWSKLHLEETGPASGHEGRDSATLDFFFFLFQKLESLAAASACEQRGSCREQSLGLGAQGIVGSWQEGLPNSRGSLLRRSQWPWDSPRPPIPGEPPFRDPGVSGPGVLGRGGVVTASSEFLYCKVGQCQEPRKMSYVKVLSAR